MSEDKISCSIIGCANNVYEYLGNGFDKSVYLKAIEYELNKINLSFDVNIIKPVYYKNFPVGEVSIEFIVEKEIMVIVNVFSDSGTVDLKQGLNYLNLFRLNKGILLNFGERILEVKKLRNPVILI